MFKESPLTDHGGPGMLDATWEILIMLLVAAILGYLIRWAVGRIRLGKLRGEMNKLTSEKLRLGNELEEKNSALDKSRSEVHKLTREAIKMRSDADECKRQRAKLEGELTELRLRSIAPVASPIEEEEVSDDPLVAFVSGVKPPEEPEPKFVPGPKPAQVDDLKKVEGVGPKIEEHLNNGGIWNYKQLSNAKVPYLREILDAAGPAYTIHDPGTWPEQGQLCLDGKWDELAEWQSKLKGGRRRTR